MAVEDAVLGILRGGEESAGKWLTQRHEARRLEQLPEEERLRISADKNDLTRIEEFLTGLEYLSNEDRRKDTAKFRLSISLTSRPYLQYRVDQLEARPPTTMETLGERFPKRGEAIAGAIQKYVGRGTEEEMMAAIQSELAKELPFTRWEEIKKDIEEVVLAPRPETAQLEPVGWAKRIITEDLAVYVKKLSELIPGEETENYLDELRVKLTDEQIDALRALPEYTGVPRWLGEAVKVVGKNLDLIGIARVDERFETEYSNDFGVRSSQKLLRQLFEQGFTEDVPVIDSKDRSLFMALVFGETALPGKEQTLVRAKDWEGLATSLNAPEDLVKLIIEKPMVGFDEEGQPVELIKWPEDILTHLLGLLRVPYLLNPDDVGKILWLYRNTAYRAGELYLKELKWRE